MIGTQIYPWMQLHSGQEAAQWRPDAMRRSATAGLGAWEDFLPASETELKVLGELLRETGLKAPSVYANAPLHRDDWREVVASVAARVRLAREFGLRVLVLNPEPINWSGTEDKSDAQLRVQATAMQALGLELRAMSVELAYHTHHMEMRHAAREFHHTLLATTPHAVGLCLDAHWIYRGAGNSQVALDDIVQLYGNRIVSLHLRQSHNGIWDESLGEGDIDYAPLAAKLRDLNFNGPVIVEQASEAGSPKTVPFDEALARSAAWAKGVFDSTGL